MKGLVIKNTGSWYTVKTDDGNIVESKIKGNLVPTPWQWATEWR